MGVFLIALLAVGVLLLTAVPGYLLMKKKMLSESCIPGFSKVLLFVCQPCLAIYSFNGIPFSVEMLRNIGIFAPLMILIHAIMLGGSYLVLKKKAVMPIYRILTIGTTFGNCAFFGIPIIEALLPEEAAGLIVYTTVYAVVMNVLGWTVGSAIIAQDIKYMSLKKTFVNPAMIGVGVALLIYITGIDFPSELDSMISSAARMATPLSMIVMGMRLATMDIKSMFTDIRIYLTVAVKQLLMPLIAFGTVMLLLVTTSVDVSLLRVFFITCSCPAASIVLNFAEIVGEGQKNAANFVLISTLLSVVTLPLMMFLLPLIA
jgi:predicted permease